MIPSSDSLTWQKRAGPRMSPVVCILQKQAVPLSARKNNGQLKGVVDGLAPLLQLPHMDFELSKKLARKRVRSLQELASLSAEERQTVLGSCGLDLEQVQQNPR
jgi:preprotein translocase subunit Sec63